MTTQISVRLPGELVEFMDELVADGKARSRASVVERALERELRRHLAERDIAILTAQPHSDDDDLDGLAAWSARRPVDIA